MSDEPIGEAFRALVLEAIVSRCDGTWGGFAESTRLPELFGEEIREFSNAVAKYIWEYL